MPGSLQPPVLLSPPSSTRPSHQVTHAFSHRSLVSPTLHCQVVSWPNPCCSRGELWRREFPGRSAHSQIRITQQPPHIVCFSLVIRSLSHKQCLCCCCTFLTFVNCCWNRIYKENSFRDCFASNEICTAFPVPERLLNSLIVSHFKMILLLVMFENWNKE